EGGWPQEGTDMDAKPTPDLIDPATGPAGYELLEEIARDGQGVVYRAWQPRFGRPVALEILHAATALPESSFLDHPHIAPVYGGGVPGGRPWLSAGLTEGRSLAELLRQGPLAPRAAAWITAAVARAIHYAHRRGACHGRLAPERIVLDGLGLPYVTGFGLGE